MSDFLVEIGTEELPPNSLQKLGDALQQNLIVGLKKANLTFTSSYNYVTPRRLAVLITDLASKQPERIIERRGPALQAAFDKEGKPTKATLGFADSCGAAVSDLDELTTEKGSWLFYKQKQTGEKTVNLIPEIVKQALKKLPIPRMMRWGAGDNEFIRPVHWLVLMYGNKVIKAELFGRKADRYSYGHRFHHPEKIAITKPADYVELLYKEGFVVASFEKRKYLIVEQIKKINKNTILKEDLLNEVTSLVEWPVVLLGSFKAHFLRLPQEVLITSLQKHQKCFSVADDNNKLLSHFIAVSNIKSKKPKQVITGNERVINARLTDAEFFYNNDLKQPLEDNLERLKKVIFQVKLGTMYEKTQRVAKLAEYIAARINTDVKDASRAAQLSKTDLVTEMVGEFPELQGIMGCYYAKANKEPKAVAIALQEQYMPRFSGDSLPASKIGQALAIADRLDTLVGIFAINQLPTGDKDPFGLRRAALGILRIIIEKKLELNLADLVEQAIENYLQDLHEAWHSDPKPIMEFFFDRLQYWYLEQGITPQIFAAVLARKPTAPLDFAKRIQAVTKFQKLAEAEALASANKRVSNILKKAPKDISAAIDSKLLIEPEEQELAKQMAIKDKQIRSLYKAKEYTKVLTELAELKQPIDNFFDKVMVMADDKKIQNNRLALLTKLRELFLHVADISLL